MDKGFVISCGITAKKNCLMFKCTYMAPYDFRYPGRIVNCPFRLRYLYNKETQCYTMFDYDDMHQHPVNQHSKEALMGYASYGFGDQMHQDPDNDQQAEYWPPKENRGRPPTKPNEPNSYRELQEKRNKDRHVFFLKALLQGKTFSLDDKYHFCTIHQAVVDIAHLQTCSCIPRGNQLVDMLEMVKQAPQEQ